LFSKGAEKDEGEPQKSNRTGKTWARIILLYN
jgi:hypothetical protein